MYFYIYSNCSHYILKLYIYYFLVIDTEMNTASTSGTSDMQPDKEEKVNKSKKRKQTTKNSKEPAKKQQKESPSKGAVLASPESDESGSENPEW